MNLYEKLKEGFIKSHLCPIDLGIEYEDCNLTCKECRKNAIRKWEEYERMIENDE